MYVTVMVPTAQNVAAPDLLTMVFGSWECLVKMGRCAERNFRFKIRKVVVGIGVSSNLCLPHGLQLASATKAAAF